MTNRDAKPPPSSAQRLLKLIHEDNGDFTHLGDFAEVFQAKVTEKGRFQACLWYWMQIIRSAPGFIRNRLYWSFSLLKNYVKIALRNVFKSKGFSFINLSGLVVGLVCFILILVYVQFERSYDRFHEKCDNLFRLIYSDSTAESDVIQYSKDNPDVMVPLLQEDFPEIVRATRYLDFLSKSTILQYGNKIFIQDGLYTDTNFLEMFSFPLIEGHRERALDDPNSIIISQTLAQKLFGNEDPLGKILIHRDRRKKHEVKITGIIEDPPLNSHLHFDFLLSVQSLISEKAYAYMFNTWDVGNFTIYVETRFPQDKIVIEEKFPAFTARHMGISEEEAKQTFQIVLQPVADIHLKSRIRGELSTNYEMTYVYLFSSFAFIILLIACINHMNLTTARTSTRAQEIGIRKVVGANRTQLILQFLGESFLTAVIATVISLLLAGFLLTKFNHLIGTPLEIKDLKNTGLLFWIVGTTFGVGIASGLYPAFVLSAFQPSHVLKEKSNSRKGRTVLRNALVVTQFTASIILIIGTLIIYNQLQFIKKSQLGYDREHVVVIPIREPGTRHRAKAIKNELLNHPEIAGVSLTSGLPLDIRSRLLNVKLKNNNGDTVKTEFRFDYIDEDFLDVFKIEMDQGRNFMESLGGNPQGVLINETFVKHMGWSEPLGKMIPAMKDDLPVIGVIRDFNFSTFHQSIEPMVLYYSRLGSNIAVRTNPGDVSANITLVRRVFEKHTKSQPFDYYFLDDRFDSLYKKEQRTAELFGLFALIGICIACLGLLGLASFSVERRTKEVGIRKVLGASIPQIFGLLTKEFFRLIALANIIAWPVAYLAMSTWLQNFAYRISIKVWLFLIAFGFALGLAFFIVATQTLKAALADPVNTLRYE